MLSNAAEGQTDQRASGARTSQATQAQEAHHNHNKHQLEREPAQSTSHTRPSEGGDNTAETSGHMDARETRTYVRLPPPSAPVTQVALLDEDLEPEPEEEAE